MRDKPYYTNLNKGITQINPQKNTQNKTIIAKKNNVISLQKRLLLDYEIVIEIQGYAEFESLPNIEIE